MRRQKTRPTCHWKRYFFLQIWLQRLTYYSQILKYVRLARLVCRMEWKLQWLKQVALFVRSGFTLSVGQGGTWELVSFVCTESLTTVSTKALLLLSDMCTLWQKKIYLSYFINLLHFHLIKCDACPHFQQQLNANSHWKLANLLISLIPQNYFRGLKNLRSR